MARNGSKTLTIRRIGDLVANHIRLSADRYLGVESIQRIDWNPARPSRRPQVSIEGVVVPGAVDQGSQFAELVFPNLGLFGPFENGIDISPLQGRPYTIVRPPLTLSVWPVM